MSFENTYANKLASLSEEIDSANNYFTLATEATSRSEAMCFQAAAVDECEHAQFLYETLRDGNEIIPDDVKSRYDELRTRYYSFR